MPRLIHLEDTPLLASEPAEPNLRPVASTIDRLCCGESPDVRMWDGLFGEQKGRQMVRLRCPQCKKSTSRYSMEYLHEAIDDWNKGVVYEAGHISPVTKV